MAEFGVKSLDVRESHNLKLSLYAYVYDTIRSKVFASLILTYFKSDLSPYEYTNDTIRSKVCGN